MSIINRLLDAAKMRTQFPEWLCRELEDAAHEIASLRLSLDFYASKCAELEAAKGDPDGY